MTFTKSTYANFIAQDPKARENLFLTYVGPRNDFDVIIVGSGIGGGVLADDLADRLGKQKRILVLEAGSFLYPTHVYNFCRFSNSSVARHFASDVFWQSGNSNSDRFIGEMPQLIFGGRSVFWSGLIPRIQPWELDFFPSSVRNDLTSKYLALAGKKMNESKSMGKTAVAIVKALQASPLSADFAIEETPRALDQPYLKPEGTPGEEFFTESTGVFNTAELLINQLGLTPGVNHGDHAGLQVQVNQYVEDIQNFGHHYKVLARNTLDGSVRYFEAPTVVLAAGSIESPKLLRRSSLFAWLPDNAKRVLGKGLTDHPTSKELAAFVTNIGTVKISKKSHAKIIFYSLGNRDANGEIQYPFNVEMNINHEYWHLRENDPTSANQPIFSNNDPGGPSRLDIKFSFGNCLDSDNEIKDAPPFGYVPEVNFKNLSHVDDLSRSRFVALAGWRKSNDQIFTVMNDVAKRIFAQFKNHGSQVVPDDNLFYNQGGKGFGWGTVHHAAGSLRMPNRPAYDANFQGDHVVDEDLRVAGHQNLYVCDMSVMPMSTAANPVRTLVALALRLSSHFG